MLTKDKTTVTINEPRHGGGTFHLGGGGVISLQPAIFHQKKIINASLVTHKNCLSFLQKIDHKTIDPVLYSASAKEN